MFPLQFADELLPPREKQKNDLMAFNLSQREIFRKSQITYSIARVMTDSSKIKF